MLMLLVSNIQYLQNVKFKALNLIGSVKSVSLPGQTKLKHNKIKCPEKDSILHQCHHFRHK